MSQIRVAVWVLALAVIVCTLFLSLNLSVAGTVDLPKTGQTTCYDSDNHVISCAETGQDGDIQAGVAWPDPRFRDNDDGTITDHLTGLMWLKDGNCMGPVTWQEALNKVADLNANPGNYECGGYKATYNDWSLPNVNELESLINVEPLNPAIYLEGKGFENCAGGYWSSTTDVATGFRWVVDTGCGEVQPNVFYPRIYAWPVRGVTTSPAAVWKTGQTQSHAPGDDGDLQRGVAWPDPRFTDHGDGTVTDNLTGLMWLRDASCFGRKSWQDAFDTVADFNVAPQTIFLCGNYSGQYADWRLPNRKELHSLTDFSQSDPALPDGHPFFGVALDGHWSSTSWAAEPYNAWAVGMDSGVVLTSGIGKLYGHFVWPVRDGQPMSSVFEDIEVDIQANGQDGPIWVFPFDPISIHISLDPGDRKDLYADWWIVVDTPTGWFSYVRSEGWQPDLHPYDQAPLVELSPPLVLPGIVLAPGLYAYYFSIDDNADGLLDETWVDQVSVIVARCR